MGGTRSTVLQSWFKTLLTDLTNIHLSRYPNPNHWSNLLRLGDEHFTIYFSWFIPALVLIPPASLFLYRSISASLYLLHPLRFGRLTSTSASHLDVSLRSIFSSHFFVLTHSHASFISIWFICLLWLPSLHPPPPHPSLKHILFLLLLCPISTTIPSF